MEISEGETDKHKKMGKGKMKTTLGTFNGTYIEASPFNNTRNGKIKFHFTTNSLSINANLPNLSCGQLRMDPLVVKISSSPTPLQHLPTMNLSQKINSSHTPAPPTSVKTAKFLLIGPCSSLILTHLYLTP